MISRFTHCGWLTAALVLVADQLSKWALMDLGGMRSSPLIHLFPFMDLVMVWNQGISFGLLSGKGIAGRIILTLLALAIVVWLARWLARTERMWTAVAIGGIIGGALSNVVDRLMRGAVADFFYFHLGPYYWPAFNLADAAICVGVALLCLESMLHRT